jgi:hypothetical protein
MDVSFEGEKAEGEGGGFCGFRFEISPSQSNKKQANDRSQRGLPKGGLLKANVSR